VLAEGALHAPRRVVPAPVVAQKLARATRSTWQQVRVQARDGTGLDAWLFVPAPSNGAAVVLLHGVGDTRLGMTGYAPFLLRSGFAVLLPDSRGHGSSGGDLITYGVQEAADVHTWTAWLAGERGFTRLYGMGRSMGAAVLLQALPDDPRILAAVADCPFATFQEIATDRLRQRSGLPSWLLYPATRIAFLYAFERYGVDLWKASAEEAVRHARVPILLIHGTADGNVPVRHSRELHAANPVLTRLWEVPGAGHVESLNAAPEAYAAAVLKCFGAEP